jgi:tRNA pseudouridine38-40 synthase
MRTIKLTIAYDGTDFHGWQIQPGVPTVQGLLVEILERMTQENLSLQGAGRTDAGVHAAGQVASFQTASGLAPEVFLRACNALLPAAIRVRAAEEVPFDFHARWSAQDKTYRYRIYRGQVLPPFICRYVLHEPRALDFEAMAAAGRHFEGEHDFTSFAASTGDEEEDRDRIMVRSVHRSELTVDVDAEEWIYTICGQSFLRNMVRKIVGTLLEVGRGRLAADDIPALLERRDRTCSGPTAPPQGLCLMGVTYPAIKP